jgi:hypothetical protein
MKISSLILLLSASLSLVFSDDLKEVAGYIQDDLLEDDGSVVLPDTEDNDEEEIELLKKE